MAREIVIDIETKRSFEEVGGQQNLTKLGVSCAGVYFYATDSYYAFEERELGRLEEELAGCDRIIGFNIIHFDLPVLGASINMERIKHVPKLDLMAELVKTLGHRVSLESLATATLNAQKSGSGLQAIEWYKEGKIDLIKKYCLDDVRITKALYEYGKANKKLFYNSYFKNEKLAVAAEWGDVSPLRIEERAGFQGRLL